MVSGCSGCRFKDLHGVSVADVLAGCLDDGLAGLVERPVDAVVGPGVSLLDQGLQLWDRDTTSQGAPLEQASQLHLKGKNTTGYWITTVPRGGK